MWSTDLNKISLCKYYLPVLNFFLKRASFRFELRWFLLWLDKFAYKLYSGP